MRQYDVVVVGGGPGGYIAAIRASQLGLKTALVEREHLGGICLNWGCIPTKALLKCAEAVTMLGKGDLFGFSFDRSTLKVDYAAAQKRSRAVSARLVKGIEFLMKKNKIDVILDTATLKDAKHVALKQAGETLEAKNVILATGARASALRGLTPSERVMTPRAALEMKEVPKRIVIVGAGAIGMEFAGILRAYGAEVTVVEYKNRVLPLEDEDVSAEVAKAFVKRGIRVLTGAGVTGVDETPGELIVKVSQNGTSMNIACDKALVSVGITPNTDNLGLEALGVRMERGYIQVDDAMQTSVPGLYAIGDITGKLALAHTASAQGVVAAEHIAGLPVDPITYQNIPRCTYCAPEVGSVGLTEAAAREAGHKVEVGKFPFAANGKALAGDEADGFVKIVADEAHGEILGVHIVGPHATELIAGPAGVIALEGTAEELAHIVHPHPTLSEAVMEAAHAVLGGALNA